MFVVFFLGEVGVGFVGFVEEVGVEVVKEFGGGVDFVLKDFVYGYYDDGLEFVKVWFFEVFEFGVFGGCGVGFDVGCVCVGECVWGNVLVEVLV